VPVQLSLQGKDAPSTSFIAVVAEPPVTKGDVLLTQAVLRTLGDLGQNDEELTLSYPKTSLLSSWSVDELTHAAVLLLGPDEGGGLTTLRAIEFAVNLVRPLRGWILKDYHDFVDRDLLSKLLTMACCSNFVLVHDSRPGGHLTEIGVLAPLTIPIAILSPSKRSSSWMVDPIVRSNSSLTPTKVFSYELKSDATSLVRTTLQACDWASRQRVRMAKQHERRYPRRRREREAWRALEPWR